MSTDPVCVRRAKTVEEAEIIVAWLDENGIEATIVDPSNPGVMAFGVTDPEGIAIWVADSEKAERAATLLAEHDARSAGAETPDAAIYTVDVACPDCGHTGGFPTDLAGTVQECPECGANVDVPPAP